MNVVRSPMIPLVVLVAMSAAVYTYRLDRVPAFLTLDEAHFSVHAHAIARTGRNLNGDMLPLLISLEDPEGEPIVVPWGHTYYLPFGMYLIAAALHFLPLNEVTVRLPSALLGGVINVTLMYFAARALFRDHRAAVWSAATLAFTPANVIISRPAIDSVCQLPFTLGFLWCLGLYRTSPRLEYAFAAGAILGAGLYAYVTSSAFMPFFLVLFWLFAWRTGTLDRRAWGSSLAGFLAASAPMLLWVLFHADAFASIRLQYNRSDPGYATLMETTVMGGIGAGLREFLRIYWSYFDPSFLFVQGGNTRTLSTGEVGVFLAPVAFLVVWGLNQLRAHRWVFWLLIICLLSAPVPAAIKGVPYQIQRASGLIIVFSLLSGYGLAALWASRRRAGRGAVVLVVTVMAWQFSGFARDYFGHYRIRSAHAYDPTAFPDAAVTLIAEDEQRTVPRIYLPGGLYDISAKWRFHATKHDRTQLLGRTHYFMGPTQVPADAPEGALAVIAVSQENPVVPATWETVKVVRNLTGEPTLAVLRRVS